jgi:hypothetical protein
MRIKFFIFLLLIFPLSGYCGVINPDISVLGQVFTTYTNDPLSPDKNKAELSLGEAEIVFDSALNPYAKGFIVISIDDSVVNVEEAYCTFVKGLPQGMGLRVGKFRLPFGKINPLHPHAYPFIETPRVLQELLPGEESFNDTAIEASYILPTPDVITSIFSVDMLKGETFKTPDAAEGNRAGWLAHLGNSYLWGDLQNVLEFGLSATEGTNDPGFDTKTRVLGLDLKSKIHPSTTSVLTLSAEWMQRKDERFAMPDEKRNGFLVYGDYKFHERWNTGLIYDQYESAMNEGTNKTIKAFGGFSVLEETTLFRLSFEHFMPEQGDPVNTIMLQLVFSMGPHKAHQF